MKFFRNRIVAAVIAVIVMAASLLGGVKSSANRASAKIEKLFYDGTNSVGSDNTVSIYDQLKKRCDAALGIVTLAANIDGTQEDIATANSARNDIVNNDKPLRTLYEANTSLEEAVQSLIAKCEAAGMSDRDKEGFERYVERFNGAQKLIEQNSYNDKVDEFNSKVLGVFPMSVIKGILGIDAPERFS